MWYGVCVYSGVCRRVCSCFPCVYVIVVLYSWSLRVLFGIVYVRSVCRVLLSVVLRLRFTSYMCVCFFFFAYVSFVFVICCVFGCWNMICVDVDVVFFVGIVCVHMVTV